MCSIPFLLRDCNVSCCICGGNNIESNIRKVRIHIYWKFKTRVRVFLFLCITELCVCFCSFFVRRFSFELLYFYLHCSLCLPPTAFGLSNWSHSLINLPSNVIIAVVALLCTWVFYLPISAAAVNQCLTCKVKQCSFERRFVFNMNVYLNVSIKKKKDDLLKWDYCFTRGLMSIECKGRTSKTRL